MSDLGEMLSKLVQLKRIANRGMGAEPPAAVDYGFACKVPTARR